MVLRAEVDAATDVYRRIEIAPGSLGVRSAGAFLEEYRDVFGVLPRAFRQTWSRVDALGRTAVAFEQRHFGVPVFGAEVRVHFDADGELVRVMGDAVPVPLSLSVAPRIEAAEAEQAAIAVVAAGVTTGPLYASQSRLVVLHTGLLRGVPGTVRLAWEVHVGEEQVVFVDARSGRLLERFDLHPDVLFRRVFDGDLDNEVWAEADGPYGGGDPEVEDGIEFTEDAYDLFANLSGGTYLSFDGASAEMLLIVDAPLSCPNASWNGTSANVCNAMMADDFLGHEWTHGYTEYTHGLIYAWQSGAINEGYSDIYGEVIDLLNGAGTDAPGGARADGACSGAGDSVRWLMGEDLAATGVVRDMWTPTCEGDPGRVGDGQFWCGSGDNGGVHTNSGVVNHAFALVVDGGSSGGVDVAAIGLTKAAHIYWRAMQTYQTQASGFADHADALEQSCDDLRVAATDLPDLATGAASGEVVVQADCDAVADALLATEMRDTLPCSFSPLLDPDTPSLCPEPELQEITTWLVDFEVSPDDWTFTNQGVEPEYQPRDWAWVDTLPDGRAGHGLFALNDVTLGNCADDDQSGVMRVESPDIVLPDNALPVLGFDHWVATEPNWDGGNLWIAVNGGAWEQVAGARFLFNGYNNTIVSSPPNPNPLAGQEAFTGTDGGAVSGSWGVSYVDLDGLAVVGDTVRLRFDFGVDGCNGRVGWYVDDVRLMQCGECADDSECDDTDACTTDTCDMTSWECTFVPTDTDTDGTPDCSDGCPNDPDKTEPGVCGCGVADDDTDDDGTEDCNDGCPDDPNKTDPGVCGCGVPDDDTDADGTEDCIDGCPDDPEKTEAGVCGCAVADDDTDADGTEDCIDGCPDDPDKLEPGACGCGEPDTDADGDGIEDCNDVGDDTGTSGAGTSGTGTAGTGDPDPTDPGSAGEDTADPDTTGPAGGSGGQDSDGPDAADPAASDGCACTTDADGHPRRSTLLLLVLAAAFRRRRR